MGISAPMVEWFDRLRGLGVLPGGGELLELGPQDIMVTETVIRDVARRQPGLDDPDGAVDAIMRRLVTRQRATHLFYGLFGIGRYFAIDKFDPECDWQMDLNQPIDCGRQFPIVSNFGTSEHIFDIAQSIATTLNLVEPGGVALFVLPAFGHINHGFFNIHPTLFFDICLENGYQLVDYVYCDNFVVRARMRDAQPSGQIPEDFDSYPIRLSDLAMDHGAANEALAFRIAQNFAQNMLAAQTIRFCGHFVPRVSDYSFVAIRKIPGSVPVMRYPTQGVYRPAG